MNQAHGGILGAVSVQGQELYLGPSNSEYSDIRKLEIRSF